MRIVATHNSIIELMHEVRSVTRIPIERLQKVFQVY